MKLLYKKNFFALILFVLDLSLFLSCFFLASVFLRTKEYFIGILTYNDAMALPIVVMFTSFTLRKLYHFSPYLFWDEIKNVVDAVLSYIVILVLMYVFSYQKASTLVFILTGVIYVIPVLFMRYLYRLFLVKTNLLRTKALIIGTGFQGHEFDNNVSNHAFSTYKIVGYITKYPEKLNGKNVLGTTDDLDEVLSANHIDEVVIAVPQITRKRLCEIIGYLEGKVKKIKFIPDMYGLMTFSTEVQNYDRILTITATQGLYSPINRCLKRSFDASCGVVGLGILLIIYPIIHIFIKVEDKGKVMFLQDRIGKQGKTIRIWKFRTMIKNAEKKLDELMNNHPEIREEYEREKKLKNDPRITKIGRILRKASLDEFPQFLNVIRGEMSMVGPRPYLIREKDDMKELYSTIIKTKPGITGLWQASGRNELSFNERLLLDQYYVRNWTLWFDIIIVLKTIKSVIFKDGITEE